MYADDTYNPPAIEIGTRLLAKATKMRIGCRGYFLYLTPMTFQQFDDISRKDFFTLCYQ